MDSSPARSRDVKSVQKDRLKTLNAHPIRDAGYVLYWMQQSQRAEYNHALEFAIQQADELERMVIVVFGLTENYPEANLRHYTFMLQGLLETRDTLASRGIQLVLRLGHPPDVVLGLEKEACLIVCDRGYLRHQRTWRRDLAANASCRVVQVESDVVVPIEIVSSKAEYAARTIRPKIHRHLKNFLTDLADAPVKKPSLGLRIRGHNMESVRDVLQGLTLDTGVPSVASYLAGGTSAAKRRLGQFIHNHLEHYVKNSNQPQTDDISRMGPYLHFGQISPLYVALRVIQAPDALQEAKDAFIEQLVVRRELAINFVYYTPDYDKYACIPAWAAASLEKHSNDPRKYLYSRRQLENAATHDPYWNAAMREMKHTGFMHNYMRMYWGKKILQWSRTPRQAFRATLALNNKYFLDGRDPNSYAGVAWIYGVHDRAWQERPIFGKVRYMAAAGLERKCDIGGYVKKVDALVKKAT